MPELQRAADSVDDCELVTVGIRGSTQRMIGTANMRGLRAPIVLDQGQRIARAFGIESVPTTVVLDRSGVVVSVLRGARTEADLARACRAAL